MGGLGDDAQLVELRKQLGAEKEDMGFHGWHNFERSLRFQGLGVWKVD